MATILQTTFRTSLEILYEIFTKSIFFKGPSDNKSPLLDSEQPIWSKLTYSAALDLNELITYY